MYIHNFAIVIIILVFNPSCKRDGLVNKPHQEFKAQNLTKKGCSFYTSVYGNPNICNILIRIAVYGKIHALFLFYKECSCYWIKHHILYFLTSDYLKTASYCYISPYKTNWLLKKLMIIIWTVHWGFKITFKTFLVSLRKLFGMMEPFALKQRSLWQPTYSFDNPINCWSVVKSSLQVSWVQIVNSVSCTIDHFTVVSLVAWPLNENEAGGDLVLIETSLLFLCKFVLISMRTTSLT